MEQGHVTAASRLGSEAIDEAVATTVRTAREIGRDLDARADRLLRPTLIYVMPRVLDGAAVVIAAVSVVLPDRALLAWWALALLALNLGATSATNLNLRVAEELPGRAGRLAVSLLIMATLFPGAISPLGLGRLGLTALALLTAGRMLSYHWIRTARLSGTVVERTLVVGDTPPAVELAATLDEHREFGLVPVGLLPWRETSLDKASSAVQVAGEQTPLEMAIRDLGVSTVVLALEGAEPAETAQAVATCRQLPCELYVIPILASRGLAPEGKVGQDVYGIPLVRIPRTPLQAGTPFAKRLTDVVLSSVALVLTSPIFALGAVAVRLSSPGPIFFRQERIGRGGRPFNVLKFRTMLVNGDSDTTWTVLKDGRVTSVGRFLRNTSIDELPQLINVLRGEMSLIGPRPERSHFVNEFGSRFPNYHLRHRAEAGITGWAQVHGLRGDTSIADRVRLDNHYIEHWSFWLDLTILARTVKAVIKGALGS